MIEGSFRDVSLPALMQLLCFEANKSFRIRVTADNQKGYILVRRGAVIAAKFGILEGEDAICEFLSWEDGAFLAEQVVAQTDVEKNLRFEIVPKAGFIQDCAVLAEQHIGLNSEITGAQHFVGSAEWKILVRDHPLDRESFSVLAWLREGRKMHQAFREFGLDIVRATEILAQLIRTQSIQVIRPGASVPEGIEGPRVEYSLVQTTGGQQEAAANLAKEAARALDSADVGEEAFLSTSFKSPAGQATERSSSEPQTQSGEYTQVRSSMEARLRAKKNSATGNNLPAYSDRAGQSDAQKVAPVARNDEATPKQARPDLFSVLQNRPQRIIDLGDSKPSNHGQATSSTHDLGSLRQANLKEGNSGNSSGKKNGASLGSIIRKEMEVESLPVDTGIANLGAVAVGEPVEAIKPVEAVPTVAPIEPDAPPVQSIEYPAEVASKPAVTPKPSKSSSDDALSSSPFAKLTKSILEPNKNSAANAQKGKPAPTAESQKAVNAQNVTVPPSSPSSELAPKLVSTPVPAPIPDSEQAPAPVSNPPAPPPPQPGQAAKSVLATPPQVAVALPEAKPAQVEAATDLMSFEPNSASQNIAAPSAPPLHAPLAQSNAAALVEPAVRNPPIEKTKVNTEAANSSSGMTPGQNTEKPAAAKAIEGEAAGNSGQGAEEAVVAEATPEAIAPDDRRFIAKTQAMPLVAFDIERLLLTTFLATQFGKLALGNPSLDPHRRQTLLDAEYGKTLSASIDDGSRPPAAVLASYRYCLDRGYIETHDPVIPLTADLLLGRMEIDQYLLQRRRITGDELRDLMKVAREEGIKLIQVLVKSGYLTEADLETLSREQKRFAFK